MGRKVQVVYVCGCVCVDDRGSMGRKVHIIMEGNGIYSHGYSGSLQ